MSSILTELGKEMPNTKEPDLPKIDSSEFLKVVNSRRSIRKYTGEAMPADVMNQIIDCGLKAPNSSNLQPWEFYWVRSPEKKALLVEACLGQPAASTASELVVCVARTRKWPETQKWMINILKANNSPVAAMNYYTKIVPLAYSQGPLGVFGPLKKLAVFVSGLSRPTPRGPASLSDMEVWANKSTALACQNMMLAARALGYDSCPMEGLDEVRVKKILNLPSDASICMTLSFGKRAPGGVYGPQLRRPRSEMVFEI